MTPAEHIAEAERLLTLAHALNGNYRDRDGRVTLATEAAEPLAALATAHATIAAAIEAQWTRQARGGR
jgi:hypothetical protein